MMTNFLIRLHSVFGRTPARFVISILAVVIIQLVDIPPVIREAVLEALGSALVG